MWVTEIHRGKSLPDEVAFDVGESLRWFGITVVCNGTLYYKEFGEPAKYRPDFAPAFYAGLVSDLVGDSTTKALEFLFHMGAETTRFQVTHASDMECHIVLLHGGEERWHGRLPVQFPQDSGEIYRMAQAIDCLCWSAKN